MCGADHASVCKRCVGCSFIYVDESDSVNAVLKVDLLAFVLYSVYTDIIST